MEKNQISYDRDGHLIYCYFQGKPGDRRKLIGTINEKDKTFYKKINPQTHTLNKSISIGLSYEMLKLEFVFIEILCGYNTYKTTRKYFLEKSDFKKFGKYELQKFLPISDFGIERALNWEREQTELLKNKFESTCKAVKKLEVGLQESLF